MAEKQQFLTDVMKEMIFFENDRPNRLHKPERNKKMNLSCR